MGAEKELEELRGRVRESEKAHIESRRAQQELNHQIQQLESERKRQTQEMNDMHGRLVRGQEKEDELRKENLSLKQQVKQRIISSLFLDTHTCPHAHTCTP